MGISNLFVLLLLITVNFNSSAQNCPGFVAYTQQFIDSIPEGCEVLQGSVIIGSFNEPANISDLSVLKDVRQITGSLVITNTALTNLDDLANLESVGFELVIEGNKKLKTVNLPSLQSIFFNLVVSKNDSLETLQGNLPASLNLNRCDIIENNLLNDISMLDNLEVCNIINIGNNGQLENIDFLERLNNVTNLRIWEMSQLETISIPYLLVLNNFEIRQNPKLKDLCGIKALEQISNLQIEACDSILNFDCLSDWQVDIQNLEIRNNELLNSALGLQNIIVEKDIIIEGNTNLLDVKFDGIVHMNNLIIANNSKLEQISGFSQLDSIAKLISIEGNSELTEINTFLNLRVIGGNLSSNPEGLHLINLPQLYNHDFFPKLNSINGDLIIDSCGMDSLFGFRELEYLDGRYRIRNNPNLEIIDFEDHLVNMEKGILIRSNPELRTVNFQNELEMPDYIQISINESLQFINGLEKLNNCRLTFSSLPQLEWINPLMSYETCTGLVLNAINLDTIDFFPNLSDINSIVIISNNEYLTTLENFTSVTSWELAEFNFGGWIDISNNSQLLDLKGFGNFPGRPTGNIYIEENDNLISLAGFETLERFDFMQIRGNPQLNNLDGLVGVSRIYDYLEIDENASLTDISGLMNIDSVAEYISITNNEELSECAVLCALDSIAVIEEGIWLSNNSSNCSNIDTVLQLCQEPSSIYHSATSNLYIYPNPTNDIINITLDNIFNGTIHLSLTDLSGNEILREECHSSIIQLDLTGLPAGVYMLRMFDESRVWVGWQKVVKL